MLGELGSIGIVSIYRSHLGSLGDDTPVIDTAANDPNFDPTLGLPGGGVIPSTDTLPNTLPSAGSSDLNALINTLTKGAVAGTKIYQATNMPPSVIPGSNLVYNPATGQFLPASGLNVSGLFGTGATVSGGSSMIFIALALGAAVLLFSRR